MRRASSDKRLSDGFEKLEHGDDVPPESSVPIGEDEGARNACRAQ
jgi:hypothetical protein